MSLHRLASVVVALLCVVSAGCAATSGGTGVAASIPSTTASSAPTSEAATSSATSSSAARTSSSEPSGSQAGGIYVPPTECLMTVDEVTAVLGGTWNRTESADGSCTYNSDRGAVFAITPIDYAPNELADALVSARQSNCDTAPVEVPETSGGFVCTEHVDDVDYVEGNVIAEDHFWLFLITPPAQHDDHPEETKALAALLAATAG